MTQPPISALCLCFVVVSFVCVLLLLFCLFLVFLEWSSNSLKQRIRPLGGLPGTDRIAAGDCSLSGKCPHHQDILGANSGNLLRLNPIHIGSVLLFSM